MSNIRYVSVLGVILVLLSISMVIFDQRPTTIAITVMSILIAVLLIIGTWKNSRKILLIWHILAWIQCFCYPFLLRRDELTGEAWKLSTAKFTYLCDNYVPQWWIELDNELSWLFTNRLSGTWYMKVKRMEITEILRKIWLFSANKIKSSESGSKQPSQLIIAAHDCHTSLHGFVINMYPTLLRNCNWQFSSPGLCI